MKYSIEDKFVLRIFDSKYYYRKALISVFYVSNIVDFLTVQVTDTVDNTVETYSIPDLVEMNKQGIIIIGVGSKGLIPDYDPTDNPVKKYYTGDRVGDAAFDTLLLGVFSTLKYKGQFYRTDFAQAALRKFGIDDESSNQYGLIRDYNNCYIAVGAYNDKAMSYMFVDRDSITNGGYPNYSYTRDLGRVLLVEQNFDRGHLEAGIIQYEYPFSCPYSTYLYSSSGVSLSNYIVCHSLTWSLNKISFTVVTDNNVRSFTPDKLVTYMSDHKFYNARCTNGVIEYSGINGTYAFDVNKYKGISGDMLSAEATRRRAVSAILKRGTCVVDENNVCLEIAPDENGVCDVPEGTKYFSRDIVIHDGIKRLVIPSTVCYSKYALDFTYSSYNNFRDTRFDVKTSDVKFLKQLLNYNWKRINWKSSAIAPVLACTILNFDSLYNFEANWDALIIDLKPVIKADPAGFGKALDSAVKYVVKVRLKNFRFMKEGYSHFNFDMSNFDKKWYKDFFESKKADIDFLINKSSITKELLACFVVRNLICEYLHLTNRLTPYLDSVAPTFREVTGVFIAKTMYNELYALCSK